MIKRNILLIFLIIVVSVMSILKFNAYENTNIKGLDIYYLPYQEKLKFNTEKIIYFELRNSNNYDLSDIKISVENMDNWNVKINNDSIKILKKEDIVSLNLKIFPMNTYFFKKTEIKIIIQTKSHGIRSQTLYLISEPPEYFWLIITLILLSVIFIINTIIFIILNKKKEQNND